MRIFLSPLFFCQHFCKHCVRIYYKQHPDEWIWQHELGNMPPLGSFQAGQGFIPDISILLMFDEFIIDGQACERIQSSTAPAWLGPWPEVLDVLGSEGALTVVDTEHETKKVASVRASLLKHDLRQPAKWANAMTYHDNLIASATRALANKVDASGDLRWEYDQEKIPGVQGPDGEYHILSHSLLMGSESDPNDPHYQLREQALNQLRTQLREVNASLAITKVLDAVPMLWAPYKGYLDAKASELPAAQEVNSQANAAKLFFSVAFPRYRPENVHDLARLRNDKRIRQLRDVIISAAKNKDVLDPSYPQRILQEVMKIEKKVGRVRKISGWASSLIGTIPLPGIGLAATAASEFVSSRMERSLRRDMSWFYLLSDGTGYS